MKAHICKKNKFNEILTDHSGCHGCMSDQPKDKFNGKPFSVSPMLPMKSLKNQGKMKSDHDALHLASNKN